MSGTCGCCGSDRHETAMTTANRPGLPALSYRIGTHGTFLDAMIARLSSRDHQELAGLRTRLPDDPLIAMLDGWATVADVLTFYQERIANEGYLRTAIERRSILEIARLVGYTLKPGVAATAYLAYTVDEDRTVSPPKPTIVPIPAGSRVQSVPGPGELPQSFETSDPFEARSNWSRLPVRRTRPQTLDSIAAQGLYLKGLTTNLEPGDPLVIEVIGQGAMPVRVDTVTLESKQERTRVTLRAWQPLALSMEAIAATLAAMEKSPFATDDETAAAHKAAKQLRTRLSTLSKAKTTEAQADALAKAVQQIEKLLTANQRFESLGRLLRSVRTELTLVEQNRVLLPKSLASSPLDPLSQPGPVITEATIVGAVASQEKGGLLALLPALRKPSAPPPPSAAQLRRSADTTFTARGDVVPRLLGAIQPAFEGRVYPAYANLAATGPSPLRVYACRVSAGLFAHHAPPKPLAFDRQTGAITEQGDWPIIEDAFINGGPSRPRRVYEEETVVHLDAVYDKVAVASWVIVETRETGLTTGQVILARAASVTAGLGRGVYGISGKTTRIALGSATPGGPAPVWIQLADKNQADSDFNAIRHTIVHAQSDLLELVEAPIETPIGACGGNSHEIELDGLYGELDPGRWLIVSGERVIEGTSGVRSSELVMLSGVDQRVDPELPGDTVHTVLTLANEGLSYCYVRDSVVIYGNVVKATQGETRKEVLGGGDGSQALQSFTLKQPPLTFVAAPTPAGAASTLVVRVNDVEWHEVETLAAAGPADRVFITQTDNDGKTTVVFGNGERAARLPTGLENVTAVYRNGIGASGNVKADQITLLAARPLGVKEVTNPLRASGGAGPESRDAARENAPLAVMTLDRLVSTTDYEDFARTFAGIGKASAARLSDGRRQVVHVTIAGADDIPIDKTSDLYRSLVAALRDYGDVALPIQVELRELVALVISANVQVQPDHQWETVEAAVRARLVEAFGFAKRALGQPVFLSEVIAAIQGVRGVAYVDVDLLDSVSEIELSTPQLLAQKLQTLAATKTPAAYVNARLARIAPPGAAAFGTIQAAQLAILLPAVPQTLILNEVPR